MKALLSLLYSMLLFAFLGCHAHRVGGSSEEGAAQGNDKKSQPPRHARRAAKPKGPSNAPMADSPAKLLVPGAVDQIQNALTQKGYGSNFKPGDLDEASSAAIRRFQGDRGLARTGVPDRETIKELGLDPDELIRNPSTNSSGNAANEPTKAPGK